MSKWLRISDGFTKNRSILLTNCCSVFPNLNIFETKIDKISVLNPINTLKRGYTVSQVKNKRIDVLDDIEINDEMVTILKDGKVISIVKEKIYEKNIN